MMPLLFIIFVVIIGRSLSLPNAMEGVLYFLKPDFSKLTSAGLLYALGQSFFALSLGVTAMPVSYTHLDVYKRQGIGTNRHETSMTK